uniref:non-specific serine/threonine protein kinase n=1 Tax=Norrisiella sphaerica TaxID=552664 RepID=A0A7S2VU50_9EUKA|mmetsp:Transcript_174/g.243  ORF Transcript_174/g.243 Transcript_174/m.243 type:complete len:699 (+) Transcript_174:121-2217(+)|eukprot:CAMPEP_0184482182 /NCGR_PEP_ID=MMETSP0113_2-20130426/3759_1 /TAXON_ID=91329 /ORGANISM="Norrisiella sphaerica, Strain BC52" /LENGTH=698 /DNA_ID=CAMNT_0026861775 /DNA_START=107 /DNA_END=2203 /DNA_ORIENTATION=-
MASVLNWVNKQVANAQSAVKKVVEAEEIPINGSRYRVVRKLGEGGYAFVYLVEDVDTGREYALKKMIAGDKEAQEIAKMEIKIMRSYKNAPNLVRYFGSCMKNVQGRRMTEYFVLMELCKRGALLDQITERIENDRYYSERQILRMFRQTCKAVSWFHTRNPPIQHRDLKIENLLMTADGTIKLCDFGSCTVRSKKYTTRSEILQEEERIQKYTTNCYMAPEMADLYKHEVISEKVDIWALGCILYVMAFFEHPFQDKGALAIINGTYKVPSGHKYSSALPAMIKNILVKKPKKRPDIQKLLQMIDLWEDSLDSGKKPDFKGLMTSKATKGGSASASASASDGESSEDEKEKERRKAAKRARKKLEKKKKKEMEKKEKEAKQRALEAAARRQARRKAKSGQQNYDDFEVDWSKQSGGGSAKAPQQPQADEAEFDVDWDEGMGANGANGNSANGTSSKQSWDPFEDDSKPSTGGDIFSVLESSNDSKSKPSMPRAPSGVNVSSSSGPRPPSSSGMRPPSSSNIQRSLSQTVHPSYNQPPPQHMHHQSFIPQQNVYGMQQGYAHSMGRGHMQNWQGANPYMMQQQHQQQQYYMYQNQHMSQRSFARQNSAGAAQLHPPSQQPTRAHSTGDINSLADAFSNTGFQQSQPSAQQQQPATNGNNFNSDPFANVGFTDHTPQKPKNKEQKEKDIFESLGEFGGF